MQTLFALDRASVRSIDANGFLHVASSVVSRACVSPYYGSEVVGHEQLGLDPQQTYYLLRPADELAKAAPSLNGVPLLSEHQPQSSEAMNDRLTVGSVSDAAFDSRTGELKASLTVWKQNEIDQIQGGAKIGLSCGYAYRAVRESGRFEGQSFSLVMKDLKFNHLAIVPEPRVSGAIIGDARPRFISQGNRIVMDENTDEGPDLKAIAAYFKSKLAPEDHANLCTMLGCPDEFTPRPGETKQAADARRRRAAYYDPQAIEDFNKRFPDAARLRSI
jgi:hypothetical protein